MCHARCDTEVNDARETSNDGESSIVCLKVGDCFSIVVNDDKENNIRFWVVIYVEGLHMVTKDKHVYVFGRAFLYGNQVVISRYFNQVVISRYFNQVVISRYFNQQGRSPYSYVQCDQGEVYIFSHLVKAIKF